MLVDRLRGTVWTPSLFKRSIAPLMVLWIFTIAFLVEFYKESDGFVFFQGWIHLVVVLLAVLYVTTFKVFVLLLWTFFVFFLPSLSSPPSIHRLLSASFVTTELPRFLLEAVSIAAVLLICLMDFISGAPRAGGRNPEFWTLGLLVPLFLSSIRGREVVCVTLLVFLMVFVVMRSVHECFGPLPMYQGVVSAFCKLRECPRGAASGIGTSPSPMMAQGTTMPEQDEPPRMLPSFADETAFLMAIGCRLGTLLGAIPLMYVSARNSVMWKRQESAALMKHALREMTALKLDTAREMVFDIFEDSTDEGLRDSLLELIAALASYKAYLPQTFLNASAGTPVNEADANPLGEHFDSDDSESTVPSETPRAFSSLVHLPGYFQPRIATLLLVDITYNFSDKEYPLRGSTGFVNVFVSKVMETVRQFDGVTLQIEASRMLVSWNTHRPELQHPSKSCRCALTLDAALQETEEFVGRSSIAATYDKFFVGCAGMKNQKASVVVGLSTLYLEKLTSLAHQIRVQVLITDSLYNAVRTFVEARPVDSIKNKGLNKIMTVYELLVARHTQAVNETVLTTPHYVEAFSLLRKLRLTECCSKLAEHMNIKGKDEQAVRLLRLSQWFQSHPERVRACQGSYHRKETSYWETLMDDADTDSDGTGHDSDSDGADGLSDEGEGSAAQAKRSRSGCSVKERTSAPTSQLLRQQVLAAVPTDDGVCPLPKMFSDTSDMAWLRADKKIGEGQFGEVWLAMDGAGSLAAVKVMKLSEGRAKEANAGAGRRRRRRDSQSKEAQESEQAEIRDTILREAELLENLRHDNIVRYIGSCAMEGYVFIVMEYLSGGSLATVLEEFRSLPISSIKRYLRDIIWGLVYLHENGVIHRDLKPHNVLMTQDGECKLADFGTAKFFRQRGQEGVALEGRGEQGRGTALYMAPETQREEYLAVTDVWALGIMIVELLTGQVCKRRSTRCKKSIHPHAHHRHPHFFTDTILSFTLDASTDLFVQAVDYGDQSRNTGGPTCRC